MSAPGFGQWLLHSPSEADALELRKAFDAGHAFALERVHEELRGLQRNFERKVTEQPAEASGWNCAAQTIRIATMHLKKNLDAPKEPT